MTGQRVPGLDREDPVQLAAVGAKVGGQGENFVANLKGFQAHQWNERTLVIWLSINQSITSHTGDFGLDLSETFLKV